MNLLGEMGVGFGLASAAIWAAIFLTVGLRMPVPRVHLPDALFLMLLKGLSTWYVLLGASLSFGVHEVSSFPLSVRKLTRNGSLVGFGERKRTFLAGFGGLNLPLLTKQHSKLAR